MESDEGHWMLSRRDWEAIDELRYRVGNQKANSFEERIALECLEHALEAILGRRAFYYTVVLRWDGQDTRVDPDLEHLPNYAAVQITVAQDQIDLSSDVYYDEHFRGEELEKSHIDVTLTPDGSFPVSDVEIWLKAFDMRCGSPEVAIQMREN